MEENDELSYVQHIKLLPDKTLLDVYDTLQRLADRQGLFQDPELLIREITIKLELENRGLLND